MKIELDVNAAEAEARAEVELVLNGAALVCWSAVLSVHYGRCGRGVRTGLGR